MKPYDKQVLQYIVNTGGNVNIAGFDDDWEPIGPKLRSDLMPRYIIEVNGKLQLTEEGKQCLSS